MFKKTLLKIFNDELPRSQLEQIEFDLLETQGIPLKKGCNSVKRGKGEFGCPENPIPVNGIRGEFIYINRLRSRIDGEGYFFHRICSYFSEVAETPVDLFELVSMSGKDWRQICLSPYFARRSRLAPSFATVEPLEFSKKKKYYEIYWEWDRGYANGSYYQTQNFPQDLSNVYRETIFNVLKLEGPYKPIAYENGIPVFRCGKQIEINVSHERSLIERASSMADSIEDRVSIMISQAMKSKKAYVNTPRDYYSIAVRDGTLSRCRQASAPNPSM